MVSDTGLLPGTSACARVPDPDVFDVHTHIGANDPDGFSCTRAELVDYLEHLDASAFVFPMHEPDGYPAADMVVAEAAASDGRLFAFCRLDPHDSPLEEARAASTTAHAASSSTHAPRASRSTTRRSRTCSPWPTSTGCRSSATPGAASPRSGATRWRSAHATPACA